MTDDFMLELLEMPGAFLKRFRRSHADLWNFYVNDVFKMPFKQDRVNYLISKGYLRKGIIQLSGDPEFWFYCDPNKQIKE